MNPFKRNDLVSVVKTNPSGLCLCGCGQETRIARQSKTERGWIRGQPIRFISGHNGRGNLHYDWKGGQTHNGQGYLMTRAVGHEKAIRMKGGYVYDHILRAEETLGKSLPRKAVVHHHPSKESPQCLIICENQGYHLLLHRRHRALRECGDVHWRRCLICHKLDSPENLKIDTLNRHYHKKMCL
jgi:hypothetical protein